MRNAIFNITNWELKEKIPQKQITSFQDFICKVFKIPLPIPRYWIKAEVTIAQMDFLRVGDIIMFPSENMWIVLDGKNNKFIIESINRILEGCYYEHFGETLLLGSQLATYGTGEPT